MATTTRRPTSPTGEPANAVVDAFLQDASNFVSFILNGSGITIEDPDPTETLNDYLRRPEVGFMGTKWACKEGGCGACTVMVSRYDPIVERTANLAIDSCLLPICALDGVAIEGVADLQRRLIGDAVGRQFDVRVERGGELRSMSIRPVELTA